MARRPDGLGSEPGFKEGSPTRSPRPADRRRRRARSTRRSRRGVVPRPGRPWRGRLDTDRVKLVNLTLKKVRSRASPGRRPPAKRAVVQHSLREFEVFETTVAEARVLLTHQEGRGEAPAAPGAGRGGHVPGQLPGQARLPGARAHVQDLPVPRLRARRPRRAALEPSGSRSTSCAC